MSKPCPTPINFAAYQPLSDTYKISAAVTVPAGLQIVATSGHVGVELDGSGPENIADEIRIAFQNVEDAISAVSPTLTKEEIWKSVYSITTYHAKLDSIAIMSEQVSPDFLGSRRPAWTAVGVQLILGNFEIAVQAAIPATES